MNEDIRVMCMIVAATLGCVAIGLTIHDFTEGVLVVSGAVILAFVLGAVRR